MTSHHLDHLADLSADAALRCQRMGLHVADIKRLGTFTDADRLEMVTRLGIIEHDLKTMRNLLSGS